MFIYHDTANHCSKINLAGPLLFPISPEKEEEDFYETEDEDEVPFCLLIILIIN